MTGIHQLDDRVLVPDVIAVNRVDVVTHDRLVQDQPIVVDDPGPRHDASTIHNASLSPAPTTRVSTLSGVPLAQATHWAEADVVLADKARITPATSRKAPDKTAITRDIGLPLQL
jgi:hypothetical protein